MLLALDTASSILSLALFDGYQVLAESSFSLDNQHTTQLSPAIQYLLQSLHLAPQDLTCLGISQGYGSYSGLRVGFGVAKGLATALNLPLIPIPTLDIVASTTPPFEGDLFAVIPAGRKRIIAGRYRWEEGVWCAQDELLNATWEDLLPQLKNAQINGEIDVAGFELLVAHQIQVLPAVWRLRRAGFLAQLAWERWQSGDFVSDLAAVNPLYLREP